ncbi:MAG: LysM peptidoglycan-binding domain-containing protein [Chloroflexota bacterium]|nr:LysM peptidoglycan-binding domain-containing protein [Chloroflexota bacterium]
MTEKTFESFYDDPLYKTIMSHFQAGEWELGLSGLDGLIEKYPLEHELRTLRQEMQLRASVDEGEGDDKRALLFLRARKVGTRVLIAAVIVVAVFWGFSRYSNWAERTVSAARAAIEADRVQFDLNNKFSRVISLLNAQRPEEALVILEEIKAERDDYPGLDELFKNAEALQSIYIQYVEAIDLEEQGEYEEALRIFQYIDGVNPKFLDVPIHILDIRSEFLMQNLVNKGDQAFNTGIWEEAINYFEEVRNYNIDYMQDEIEGKLFNSYINFAQDVLNEQPDSIEALKEARDYFFKALELKPQDERVREGLQEAYAKVADALYKKNIDLAKQEILGQADSLTALETAKQYYQEALAIYPDSDTVRINLKMAESYLQAQDDFLLDNWDAVIHKLVPVYQFDYNYADGTAKQTLYAAYIARGDLYKDNARRALAEEDYLNAIKIAQYSPNKPLLLFEAQVRLGDLYKITGNDEAAVFQYRTALENADMLESILLDPELEQTKTQADTYFNRDRINQAAGLYSELIDQIIKNFETQMHVVESGDYLALLANKYCTTVSAILQSNNLPSSEYLSPGERISIPVTAGLCK